MTDGRQITEEEATRAGEYVLGLLSAAERRAFEAEMAAFPALRDEVMAWDEDMIPLADGFAEEAPPSHVKAALDARLFGVEQKRGFWSSLALWRGLAVVSIATAAVFALMTTVEMPQPPAPAGGAAPDYVSQLAGDESGLQLAAAFDAGRGVLQINRVAGDAAPGRTLELWLIEGDNPPVSLGLLPAERRGQIRVPPDLAPRFRNAVLAVSDEPPGGSPTGTPTGAVLATGPVTML